MINHQKYMLSMLNLLSSMTTDFNFPYYHGLNVWSVATIASIALILLLFGFVSIYSIRKNAKVLKSTKYIIVIFIFGPLVWLISYKHNLFSKVETSGVNSPDIDSNHKSSYEDNKTQK